MKPRIRKINGRWKADIPQELHAFVDALNAAQPRLFYLAGPGGTRTFATVDEVTDAVLAQMPAHIALSKRERVIAILSDLREGEAKQCHNPETKRVFYVWRE